MSTGELLDHGLGVYRANIGTLGGITVVTLGLPSLLTSYVELSGGALEHPILYLLATIMFYIGSLLSTGATIWAVSEFYLGRKPTLSDALAYSRGVTGKLFVAGLAKYLLIILASLLFIVPGIIVACGYVVVYQCATLEAGVTGSSALSRSWELTKGYKGKAFVVGFVTFCLVYLPIMAAGVAVVVLPSLLVLLTVLSQVLMILLLPIIACVMTLLYYDLRVRKEGFDLQVLSEQLTTPATV